MSSCSTVPLPEQAAFLRATRNVKAILRLRDASDTLNFLQGDYAHELGSSIISSHSNMHRVDREIFSGFVGATLEEIRLEQERMFYNAQKRGKPADIPAATKRICACFQEAAPLMVLAAVSLRDRVIRPESLKHAL
ncbi:MAG: hypothetical protein DI626_04850 [Micavibrio aeruginosavorus]|uniref:Uncharacterized protein n=1 Tax=Micavibrio aeruginosavorus TaxID=349221 RepID=A0A2W5A3Q1_9BACT|nr:MAG: hypothetical protein DI626_04850 [Micavibrio aeruginosavorus]